MQANYSDNDARDLCIKLMRADTEDEVVAILADRGLWDDDSCWRPFGGIENNYSTIGNQQSRPEAALVEKLVNSVDARLTNACLVANVDPSSSDAPATVREAVARFFEGKTGKLSPESGRIQYWDSATRTSEGREITLAATGHKPDKGFPSFSIADSGEGQAPNDFPNTFLSLSRNNKLHIHFVQGTFNMGGSGALRFCGKRGLQMVLSRRNPAIAGAGSDSRWGFTIVRREYPTTETKSSVFTYLAPSADGTVLAFKADTMPIFPEGQDAYGRAAGWGSLVKLYEYEAKGFRSNIITSGGGLLRRLDLLLPEVALPIRLYECRKYRGHAGSFETNVAGIGVRLSDDRAANLEPGFPVLAEMTVLGQPMKARIYAFVRGKANEYRMRDGVLFTINGQANGGLPVEFFNRKAVGLSYLSDSLFVTVDCSAIAGVERENLFMNSRDRLSDGPLRKAIEDELADILKQSERLKELKNARRQQDIAKRIEDTKPLEDVLRSLVQRSPVLASLLQIGARIPNPFAPRKVRQEAKAYEGERYPTYFRFAGKPYGKDLTRQAFLQRRARVMLETDAVNDYFDRDSDPGTKALSAHIDGKWAPVDTYTLNLQDGTASLNLTLPAQAGAGDEIRYRLEVTDDSRTEPFLNEFVLRVRTPEKTQPGGPRKRKPRSDEPGEDREAPSALALPEVVEVEEKDWGRYEFDKHTALRIKFAGDDDGSADVYDFFVNVDNHYLRAEQKRSNQPPELVRKRFKLALVLVGLSLIQHAKAGKDLTAKDKDEGALEKNVGLISQALAPVLLPMIESLGDADDIAAA